MGNSWFEGKALQLDWWRPDIGYFKVEDRVNEVQVRVFGVPLHFWGEEFFKRLSDACGGFVAVDGEVREKWPLQWARILVKSNRKMVRVFHAPVGEWEGKKRVMYKRFHRCYLKS